MREPVLKITSSDTGQDLNAIVSPKGTPVPVTAVFRKDYPDGPVVYEWEVTPRWAADLGEPLTDPDFKRVIVPRAKGSLVVVVYDENGFYFYSDPVAIDPS